MDEFNKLAKEYAESKGEVVEGFKYGYASRREFPFKYYYDFLIVPTDGEHSKELPRIGGDFGFTIDKQTKEIHSISAHQHTLLIEQEKELEVAYNMLTNIDQTGSMNWLKARYNTNSPELLRLKKLIENRNFKIERVFKELNELISKKK